MGKKAPMLKNPLSASPSSTIAEKKRLLRPRSTEVMKRKTRQSSELSAKQTKPTSPAKPKAKPKKRAPVEVDDKKPKKPATAFFFFLEDFRKEYQEENPNVKSMRDIGKACGEKWKTMTYEQKVKYYDIATEKRAEFDEAMAKYTRRKMIDSLFTDEQESGEDQVTDEDSETDE